MPKVIDNAEHKRLSEEAKLGREDNKSFLHGGEATFLYPVQTLEKEPEYPRPDSAKCGNRSIWIGIREKNGVPDFTLHLGEKSFRILIEPID